MKLRKKLPILFLGFSLLAACGKGPSVTVCVLDIESDFGRCYDQKKLSSFDTPLGDLENWIAISSEDFELILNHCRGK